jgi:hypothetical protein
MSTTQHTGHYNLPTFGDNPNDRPSWRGDFSDAMTKIDNQMYANATNITTATAAANDAKATADAARESADTATALAQTNKADIAELDGYFGKLGVTSPTTAQNLMDTINGKADASALAGKADADDVYTKTQADGRYLQLGGYSGTAASINSTATTANNNANAAKSTATAAQNKANAVAAVTTDLTELVWIGDSYSTGYQPSGSVQENHRIPQQVAAYFGLNLHLYANNSSGFVTPGDGGKTFQTLANEAISGLSEDIKKKTKYVVVCGGRNDAGGSVQSAATACFDTLTGIGRSNSRFPNAAFHMIFLWDNSPIPWDKSQAMMGIEYACHANGFVWHPWMWTLGMGHPDWFCNGTDIHYKDNGQNNIAKACVWAIAGYGEPCGEAAGEVAMKGGCSGKVHWRFAGGVVTLTAKFTANNATGTIATLPRFISLGDNFVMVLANAGAKLGFAHLDGGDLAFTGLVGGGALSGNCWITPQSFIPICKD